MKAGEQGKCSTNTWWHRFQRGNDHGQSKRFVDHGEETIPEKQYSHNRRKMIGKTENTKGQPFNMYQRYADGSAVSSLLQTAENAFR
jgi:hypothetical protein